MSKTFFFDVIKNLLVFIFGLLLAIILLLSADFLIGFKKSNFYPEIRNGGPPRSRASTMFEINPDANVPPDFMMWYPGVFDAFRTADVEERNDNVLWNFRTERLGFENLKNASIRHQMRNKDKFIYNVTYHTDEFARRITPVKESEKRKKFMLFFGCSFTWGSCVKDDETFPAYAGELAQDYRPYNYAKGGSSVNWLLALLENRNLRAEVTEPTGVGLYVFIDEHVPRAMGDVVHSNSLYFTPYYEIENGQPVRHGDFASGRPWTTRFYVGLANSNLFKKFNLQYPIPKAEDFEFVCKLIEAARDRFMSQFPQSHFYVIFHPADSGRYGENVARCLEPKKIDYVRLNNFKPPYTSEEANFGYDLHPTAVANKYIAQEMMKALQLESKSSGF